jgi:ATP/maltotriose-dependent transcriptional regulator MalT
MLSSLISTGFYIPSLRPDHIHRLRRVDSVGSGYQMGRRITLVSAPAGYGKTSLLSERQARLTGQKVPMAWLALEEGDNDLQRFLHDRLAVVQRIFPKVGQNWIAQPDQHLPPAPVEVIAGLINEIAAVGSPLALALDDYHSITNPAVKHGQKTHQSHFWQTRWFEPDPDVGQSPEARSALALILDSCVFKNERSKLLNTNYPYNFFCGSD